MKFLFTFLFLTITTTSFAQHQNVYYLKNNGRSVNKKDSADFVRIISEPDANSKLYNVAEYYMNGQRKLAAKSKTIDPPKFEGSAISSYENGFHKSINNYQNNILTGEQYEYFPNGKLYYVKNYSGKLDINNHNDFLLTANYDSLGTALVTDGNGYFKAYNTSFTKVCTEGPLKNGKRTGEWKFTNEQSRRVEVYADGKFVSGMITNNRGQTKRYTKEESTPRFPGGFTAFESYIGKNLRYPINDRVQGIQGTALVQFIVEVDGSLSNIEILRSVSRSIDQEVIRIIKKSPYWIPATKYGEAVREEYTTPIKLEIN